MSKTCKFCGWETKKCSCYKPIVDATLRPRSAGNHRVIWTDAQIEILRKLWVGGDTASEIAAKLGFTRNAVLGKLMRMGIKR